MNMLLKDDDESTVINGKRICIDFDGVIHKYSRKYHDGSIYDRPTEGVREFLLKLKDMGYCIFVHTSRPLASDNPEGAIRLMEKWLKRWKIPYDFITMIKVPANAYIDDRAIRFTGDWNYVMKELDDIEDINKDEGEWEYYHKEIV